MLQRALRFDCINNFSTAKNKSGEYLWVICTLYLFRVRPFIFSRRCLSRSSRSCRIRVENIQQICFWYAGFRCRWSRLKTKIDPLEKKGLHRSENRSKQTNLVPARPLLLRLMVFWEAEAGPWTAVFFPSSEIWQPVFRNHHLLLHLHLLRRQLLDLQMEKQRIRGPQRFRLLSDTTIIKIRCIFKDAITTTMKLWNSFHLQRLRNHWWPEPKQM